MTWASDVTLYNTAINALGNYIVKREQNTPADTLEGVKKTAQTAVAALATPMSGTLTFPKKHVAL